MISLVLSSFLFITPTHAPLPNARSLASPIEQDLALTIDGQPITVEEFTRWLVRFRGETLAVDYVEKALLEREAKRLGQTVSQEEVSKASAAVIDRRVMEIFKGDYSLWKDELAKERRTVLGFTLELEETLRRSLLSTSILKAERVIGEETLREAWVYNYGPEGRTIEARIIEIEVEPFPTPPAATLSDIQAAREKSIENARVRAESVRKTIVETGDFAASARRHSAHDSARRGGVPVNGFLHGEWSFEVTSALAEVQAGELTQPIFGMGSWWLMQIDDVRTTPFESIRDTLLQSILDLPPTQAEHAMLLDRLVAECNWSVQPAMWAMSNGTLPSDDVVILIDDEPVLRDTYSRWLRIRNGEVIAPRFVESWIIEKKAQELGIQIPDKEVRARINNEITRLITESGASGVEEWLANKPGNATMESVVRDLLVSHIPALLSEEILKRSRKVTKEDVRRRWELAYGPGGMTRIVRLIRMQVTDAPLTRGASEEELEQARKVYEEKLELIEKIRERYDNGEDFGALARKYSDDESRLHGGEMSEPYRPDHWHSDVEEALSRVKVGELTDAITSGDSVYLFELLEMRVTPLESVEKALELELKNEPPTVPQIANQRNVLVRDVPFTVEPSLVR